MDFSFFESGTLLSLGDQRLLIGWGKRNWISNPSGVLEPVFYFPDFFLENKMPWFTHEHWKIILLKDFIISESFQENDLEWKCDSRPIFSEHFDHLQKMFEEKHLNKAVPYAFLKTPELMNETRLKMSLKAAIQSCLEFKGHLYGFWTEDEGILGVSPELLFQWDQSRILSTVACAGTHKDKTELLNAKIVEEHQIVIQGIQESLKKFGKIQQGKTEIKELAILSHLLTPLQVQFYEKPQFEPVVQALHPTPALGAYPKEIGYEWLKKYQTQLSRYRFGAPVGCVMSQQEQAFCYVAIRNVQWNVDGMLIGAGCGITADSQMEDEWQEIQLKFRSIREMLKL